MKKYFLVIFCATLLFVLTGCGKNQVKCTGTTSEDGVNLKGEVVADFDKDNKLSDAVITYELDDEEKANQYCSLFKLFESADKGISISCSGKKITIKGYANMLAEEDEDTEEEESIIGATKEEFIKAMEEEKFTCK